MKNVAFYHCCCINDWETITNILFKSIMSNEVYSLFDEIYICCVGNERLKCQKKFFDYEKIKYIDIGNDISVYEYPTLSLLWNYCNDTDCKVFYFHTKGVTWTESCFISSRNKFIDRFKHADMLYESFVDSNKEFNYKDLKHLLKFILNNLSFSYIKNAKFHLNVLNHSDVSGVQACGSNKKFYLRNFWYANSGYVKNLPKPNISQNRGEAEFWILSNHSAKYYSLVPHRPIKYGILL